MCELQMNTKFILFVKDGANKEYLLYSASLACPFWQESSGHRSFEIKRQLVADVKGNNTTGCMKTLKWAADQPEAAACMLCVYSRNCETEHVVSNHEATRAVLDERKSPLLHYAAANGNSDLVQLDLF